MRIFFVCLLFFTFLSPQELKSNNPLPAEVNAGPCYYKDHRLYVGPKGGCYYINKNGNKTYVDRFYCDC